MDQCKRVDSLGNFQIILSKFMKVDIDASIDIRMIFRQDRSR